MLGLTCLERQLKVESIRQASHHGISMRSLSRHPTRYQPSRQHSRHHHGHPVGASPRGWEQASHQTSLHVISLGHHSRNHDRVLLCCQPCFWAWWGQRDEEHRAHWEHRSRQHRSLVTHQLSLSGTRKGSGGEKQQPLRASNCYLPGKESPEGVMPGPQFYACLL